MIRSLWKRLFKKDEGVEARVLQAVADDDTCAILRLVLENPGITGEKLADRSRLGTGAIQPCLDRLAADRIIERDAGAGYSIAEMAKAAVVKHLPLNYQCPGLLR